MISVIIPTFNEEENVDELHRRLSSIADQTKDEEFEFLFVDDGSKDRTHERLQALRQLDGRIAILKLARNFGGHPAISAGLSVCKGDAAVIIAADLQDPPELIPRLIAEWHKDNRVVWAVRKNREGETFLTIFFSRLFYALMNLMTEIRQPPSGADALLVDRLAIDALQGFREKNSSYVMIIAWLGLSQSYIEYTKESRRAGKSKWNFAKKFKLMMDSLVSFSYAPMRVMITAGCVISLTGFAYAALTIYRSLLGLSVQGWASLMIVLLIVSGFQILMLGILGEYLWRTLDQAKGRPNYIIERFLTSTSRADAAVISDHHAKP